MNKFKLSADWLFNNRSPVMIKPEDVKKSFPNMPYEQAEKKFRALSVMRTYDQLKIKHEYSRGMIVSFITNMILTNFKEFIPALKEKSHQSMEGVVILDGAVYSPFVTDQEKLSEILAHDTDKIIDLGDWDSNLIEAMISYGSFKEQMEQVGADLMKVLDTSPLYTQMIQPLESLLKQWQQQYENMPVSQMREQLEKEQMQLLLDWDEKVGFFEPFNNLYEKQNWFSHADLSKHYYELSMMVLGVHFNTMLFLENIKQNQFVITEFYETGDNITLNLEDDIKEFSNEYLEKIAQINSGNKEQFIQAMIERFPAYHDFDGWDTLWEIRERHQNLMEVLDTLITDKQS